MKIKDLVDRFLSWPLPADVCADLCATMRDYPHRSGTTLLTAAQAEQMLNHVVGPLFDEISDLQEVLEDKRENTRKLDIALNGTDGAAKQASLCDLIGQVTELKKKNESLKQKLTRANDKLTEIKEMFYGQGYELNHWHYNGTGESMDNFFSENDWEPESLD
jgi:hypothetical protein